MKAAWTKQHGVALITAMLIVALAAVIGASLLTQMNLALHRSGYIWHSEQAWQYAIGIENWLGVILQRDAKQTDIDTLKEPWAQPVDYLPLEGGALAGQIIDLQSRFNLNNLAGEDPTQELQYFARLIQRVLDTDQITAQTIAASTRDWIDDDINPTGAYGAEDNYYLGLKPAYRTGNTKMVSSSEFKLLRGVTPEIYAKLAPYISTLPESTPININTAPAPVLGALAPQLDASAGEKLVAIREEQPWESVEEFLELGILAGRKVDADQLSVTTHYFLAAGRISVGKAQIDFYSKLLRADDRAIHVIAHSANTY